ncbi:MAG TPA: hydrogenase/urease maturation nickel metallochaperone HypA [Acidimicrobiales bacterium]|nr:hydrogenase/urease maturation nickel metallochaperone HypA [Acidimicrobiales bacterium]
MHELSLAEELVSACRSLADGRAVVEVSARCPTSIDQDELLAAFVLVTRRVAEELGDRCLNAARLTLEAVPAHLKCDCGFDGDVGDGQLAGHMSICPQCGHLGEVDGCLELLRINLAGGVEPFDLA